MHTTYQLLVEKILLQGTKSYKTDNLSCFYIMLQYLSVRWKGIVQLGSCILHTFPVNNEVSICNMTVMFMSCIFFLYLYICFKIFHVVYNKTQ